MKPIFFERNRVFRVYKGGKLFEDFFGEKSEDSFFPEEWIASSVEAINKEPTCKREGVSKSIDGEYFDELLKKYPEEMLGKGNSFRILVKILDSAVRLPAQAHPDKAFSKEHFNSEYGKTESWIILGTRPGAKIYFGFKDGVRKEEFVKAIDDSLTDKSSMENLMKYIEPKIGDVFLVPAKTIHAIGAGCLILEVQEPTDFTIQPEHFCDEYELSDNEMYIGLSKDDAVECFDFEKSPEAKISPETVYEADGCKIESLIGNNHTECFVINRISIDNAEYIFNIDNSYGVYVITDGSGTIKGKDFVKEVKKGDYFFIPACSMGDYSIYGNTELVECY